MSLRLVWALAFLPVVLSCKTPANEQASLRAVQTPAHGEQAALRFRSILQASLPGQWERRHLDRIVYLPTDGLSSVPDAANAQAFLDRLNERYQAVSPVKLFEKGQATPLVDLAENPDQVLRRHPVTLILVPGVFGEFIETRPMDEVVRKEDSAFARKVAAKFASAPDEKNRDERFDLETNGQVEARLSELFHAASIDDGEGRPLYRLISFAMPFMALESLGQNAEVAAIYLRRLEKLFSIIGTPDNIAFLGYSRGTPLALEMLSQAKDRPWIQNVRGLIALGGVIYGSDLADEVDTPGTTLHKQIGAVEKLLGKLEEAKGNPLKRAKIVKNNTVAWGVFLKAMLESDPSMNPSAIREIRGGDPRAPGRLLIGAWGSLGLNRFFSSYNGNIRKFKAFGEKILAAIQELKTESRLEWWRTHQVPTAGIRYYAITATMADAAHDAAAEGLAGNPVAYLPSSLDYKMLLKNHRDFAAASGLWLNDSQVAIHKARFWPRLGELLNPAQPKIDAVFLGVLGTHHWGLALETVNEMLGGGVNPFPREGLLKALATQVALDLTAR